MITLDTGDGDDKLNVEEYYDYDEEEVDDQAREIMRTMEQKAGHKQFEQPDQMH